MVFWYIIICLLLVKIDFTYGVFIEYVIYVISNIFLHYSFFGMKSHLQVIMIIHFYHWPNNQSFANSSKETIQDSSNYDDARPSRVYRARMKRTLNESSSTLYRRAATSTWGWTILFKESCLDGLEPQKRIPWEATCLFGAANTYLSEGYFDRTSECTKEQGEPGKTHDQDDCRNGRWWGYNDQS